MNIKEERRRAPRLTVNVPTLVEKIGHRELHLHPNLVPVYERVHPNGDDLGQRFPAEIQDLSANGCFICGPALPLLSRVAFTFALEGYGKVDALGWTLWRRTADAEITVEGGDAPVTLKAGFGVLFESIPLDARLNIMRLVYERAQAAAAARSG